MYFITSEKFWDNSFEISKKFKTIWEAEDAALELSKKTNKTVYIFEDNGGGFVKEITAKIK